MRGLCANALIGQTRQSFYSGVALEADKARALAAGAQGYNVKPVMEDELVEEVNRIIAESGITSC